MLVSRANGRIIKMKKEGVMFRIYNLKIRKRIVYENKSTKYEKRQIMINITLQTNTYTCILNKFISWNVIARWLLFGLSTQSEILTIPNKFN